MPRSLCALFLIFAAASTAAADPPATAPANTDNWMPYNAAGKWGFIARDAAKVEFNIPPTFEMAYPFRQNRAAVRQNKLWGFIDDKANLAIPCQFDEIQKGVFRNGVAIVKKDGLYGVIDLNGKEILPCKFKSITLDEKEARLVATLVNAGDPNDLFDLAGLYDLAGKQLMPNEYEEIYPFFRNGVTAVRKAGKSALASSNGQLLTPLQYDQMLFSDIPHFIAVKDKGQTHDLYDDHGKFLFSFAAPYVGPLVDHRACFKDAATKLNGYLDETGHIVIPAQFVMAGAFSEGLAIVQRKTGGDVEAIDTAGKTVGAAPNAFIRLDKFKNGTVWLADRSDKKLYLYNTRLEKVFPDAFYFAADFDRNGLARAQPAPKLNGLINAKGQWILQPEYSYIEPSSIPGQYIVFKDKEKGIVNAKGEVLFKPQNVSIEKWDEQFVKICPPGYITTGEYFCFWRNDGTIFYNDKKPE